MSSNPFLLEFIINLRWALHFFVNDLEYSVNNQYPQLVEDAKEVLTILSTSYATLSTLGSVPLGALQLAKEGCVYLLVSEGILGSCPPTTHAFLLQNRGTKIYSSSASSAPSHTSTDERASQKTQHHLPESRTSHTQADKPLSSRPKAPSDSSENRRSLNTSVCTDLISSITDPAVFERASQHNRHAGGFTADRLPTTSTFTATNTSNNKRTDDLRTLQKDDQAMFLLLRWLISEQILSTPELATTLEVDLASIVSSEDSNSHHHHQRRFHSRRSGRPRSKSFKEQSLMSVKMAQLVPFYLGAHVLVTRSIYMAHCMRLLSVEDVVEHVKALRPECRTLDMPSSASGRAPPSMEQAIVVWTTTALHLLLCDLLNLQVQEKRQADKDEKAVGRLEAAITAVRSLHTKMQDCSPSLFYTLIQDGVVLLLILYVYQRDILSLTDVQFASPSEKAEAAVQRGLANWRTILQLTEKLGLWVGFYAEELVYNYGGPLTLHLFSFVERLFMVLATIAEEGARVSLDEERASAPWPKASRKGEDAPGMQASWSHVTALDSVARSAIMSSSRRRRRRQTRGSEHVEGSVDSRGSYNSTIPSTVRSASGNDRSTFSSPEKKATASPPKPQAPYEASKTAASASGTLDAAFPLRPMVKRTDGGALPGGSRDESDQWMSKRVVRAKRKGQPKDSPSLDGPVARNTSVDTVATSVSALTAGSPPFGTITYPRHSEALEAPSVHLHPSERLLAALLTEPTDGSVRTPRQDTNLSVVSATSTADVVTVNQALGWSNVNVSKSTLVGDSCLPELAVSADSRSGFHTPPGLQTPPPPSPPPPPPQTGAGVEPPPTICSTGKVSEEASKVYSTPGSIKHPPPELLVAERTVSSSRAPKEVSAPRELSTPTPKKSRATTDKNNSGDDDKEGEEEEDDDDEDFVVKDVPVRSNSFHQVTLSNRADDVSSSAEDKKPTPRAASTVLREDKSPSPFSPCGSLHTCSGPRTESSFSAPFRSTTQDNAKSKSQSVPDATVASAAPQPHPICSSVEVVTAVPPKHLVEEAPENSVPSSAAAPNRVVDTDTYDASVVVDATPSQISYHDRSSISDFAGSVAASSVPAASPLTRSTYKDSVRRDVDDESYLSATNTKHCGSLDDLRSLSNLEAALAGDDKATLMKAVKQLQRINSQLVDRLQAREAGGRTPGDTVRFSPTRSLFRSSDDSMWPRESKKTPLQRPTAVHLSSAWHPSRQSLTPLSRRSERSSRLDQTVESAVPVPSPGAASYMTNMSAQLAETDVSSNLDSRLDTSYQ